MNMKTGTMIMMAVLVAVGVQADSITHGGTTINMDFVNIGYAGHAGDTANTVNGSNPGFVANNYKMGKFEVTEAQWASVIAADSNVGDTGLSSGLQPTTGSSWYEAAKFANWLTSGSYNNGAYQFSDPNTLIAVDRLAAIATYGTVYVLPTEDEWYKAAYLKSDGSAYTLYASGDSIPGVETDANYGGVSGSYGDPWDVGTGNIENNGTFDMNGNAWEWNESALDGTLDNMAEDRVFRGGSSSSTDDFLLSSFRVGIPLVLEDALVGFRVAAIPEPSSIAMVGVVSGLGLFIRRKFML